MLNMKCRQPLKVVTTRYGFAFTLSQGSPSRVLMPSSLRIMKSIQTGSEVIHGSGQHSILILIGLELSGSL